MTQVVITDAVMSTHALILFLAAGVLVTLQKARQDEILPVSVSQELKGVAILAIVFAHIGYSLASDTRFLYPLSTLAGVGVDLFLFISGYGLTISMLKKRQPTLAFYRRRLLRIFLPFWVVMLTLFLLDAVILRRTYSLEYVVRSLLGVFPRADLASDVNSVLWFITWLLLYYALYPIVFVRRVPWLSALVLFAAGVGVAHWNPEFVRPVTWLYALHTAAFPIGVLAAWVCYPTQAFSRKFSAGVLYLKRDLPRLPHLLLLGGLTVVVVYAVRYSGVGKGPLLEQTTNIVTLLVLIAIFVLKRLDIKLLYLFGIYSYEIYMVHWPLVSRYDLFFRWLPSWLAMLAYLLLFFWLGWIIQKVAGFLEKKLTGVAAKTNIELG